MSCELFEPFRFLFTKHLDYLSKTDSCILSSTYSGQLAHLKTQTYKL